MIDDENLLEEGFGEFRDDAEDMDAPDSQQALLLSQELEQLVGLTFAGITVVKPPIAPAAFIDSFLKGEAVCAVDKSEMTTQELGENGELAVIDFEKARLKYFGFNDLAEQVIKVKTSDGSYDIASFDLRRERIFIEVKTTGRDGVFPFFVKLSQIRLSQKAPEKFRLYRVFDFPGEAKLFILSGSVRDLSRLEPETFYGWARSV